MLNSGVAEIVATGSWGGGWVFSALETYGEMSVVETVSKVVLQSQNSIDACMPSHKQLCVIEDHMKYLYYTTNTTTFDHIAEHALWLTSSVVV